MKTTQTAAAAVPADQTTDRRRHARLAVTGELEGTLLPDQIPLRVLDVSEKGFSVDSPVAFMPTQEYRVRFSTLRRSHGILRVVNVHCMLATMASGSTHFAGFRFADADAAVAIRGMIAEVEALR